MLWFQYTYLFKNCWKNRELYEDPIECNQYDAIKNGLEKSPSVIFAVAAMKWPRSLIVFITFCFLHESIAQQFYYSEENEDFPYSVPILPSENLEWFLVKDPEYFKLVMFVGTDFDRFCRKTRIWLYMDYGVPTSSG